MIDVVDKNKILTIFKKNYLIFVLIILFIIHFCINMVILFQDEYAVGIDGYYYATQVRFFREHLRFASPDISLTLYFLAGVSYIFPDIIVSNKIAISILASLLVFPSYLLGKRVLNRTSGLFYALLLPCSSFLTYYTFEHIKNLGGILVFLFFLNQLYKWIESGTRKELIPAVLLLCIVIITHKLMAGIAIIIFFIALFKTFIKKIKLFLLVSAGILSMILLAGFFVPNILHITDFNRLHSLFTYIPFSGFIQMIKMNNPHFITTVESIVLMVAPFIFILIGRKNISGWPFFYFLIFLLFLLFNFPFIKYSSDNTGFRLFLLTFIPGTLFLSMSLASFKKYKPYLIVIVLISTLYYKYYTMDLLRDARNTDYILYEALLPLISLPKDSLLIVHQGFDYFYSYNSKKRAFHYLAEEKHNKRPVYRLAFGIKPALFEKYLGEQCFKSTITILPGFYYLMKEETWTQFVNQLARSERRLIFTWKNPHSYRQKYMLRNQKFRKRN